MSFENKAMICDFYELTMSNGYYRSGMYQQQAYFDVFFRKVPDGGGFAIAAGLEQVIEYVKNFKFEESDKSPHGKLQCQRSVTAVKSSESDIFGNQR